MHDAIVLPAILTGHWDTEGGAEMAARCLTETRDDLCRRDLSDLALANAQFLVSRWDLDLIVYQTAAKERIRWLTAHLARSNILMAELLTEAEFLLARIAELDWCDFDQFAREWGGHVEPPLARLQAAIVRAKSA